MYKNLYKDNSIFFKKSNSIILLNIKKTIAFSKIAWYNLLEAK